MVVCRVVRTVCEFHQVAAYRTARARDVARCQARLETHVVRICVVLCCLVFGAWWVLIVLQRGHDSGVGNEYHA